MILTRLKQIGPVQDNWYLTKMIWTVQNHFEPIGGQGIGENLIFKTLIVSSLNLSKKGVVALKPHVD